MNNKLKKTFLVVAKSGLGKNYMTDYLCDKYGLQQTLSRTTRLPRYEGEDTHTFITIEQALKELGINKIGEEPTNKNIIAYTYFDENFYYTLKEDIKDFYIIDVYGVETMDKEILKNCATIYFEASLSVRKEHMRVRGDSEEKIEQRIKNDYKLFRNAESRLANAVDNLITIKTDSDESRIELFENIVKVYMAKHIEPIV